MSDIEVHIDIDAVARRVGTLHRHARRGSETTSFEYHATWLSDAEAFSLEPELPLGLGGFSPKGGRAIFGSIGDSAPDTWGRRLMQRAERRRAERDGRPVRTLQEADYLLGVADISRLGALRFRTEGEADFQAPNQAGVPGLIALGRLLQITERILRDEETDDDLLMIFAPGSSLGGARPKASVIDQHNELSIAKFPKETDDYCVELWEAVALTLARSARIQTPNFELIRAAEKPVLLSRRFDRDGATRIPFLSALSMMGLKDGDRGSYPELVDVLTQQGAQAAVDAAELYRRMAFNVMISNVDDHLRNHGFLWKGKGGWILSPAYDLNPTPSDLRERILTTSIDLEDGTCDLDLVLSVADFFGLSGADAKSIVKEVAQAISPWRDVALSFQARPAEVKRMESAFEHSDRERALQL